MSSPVQGTREAVMSMQMSSSGRKVVQVTAKSMREYPVPQSYESPSTTTLPGMMRCESADVLQMKEQEALIGEVRSHTRVQLYASLCMRWFGSALHFLIPLCTGSVRSNAVLPGRWPTSMFPLLRWRSTPMQPNTQRARQALFFLFSSSLSPSLIHPSFPPRESKWEAQSGWYAE